MSGTSLRYCRHHMSPANVTPAAARPIQTEHCHGLLREGRRTRFGQACFSADGHHACSCEGTGEDTPVARTNNAYSTPPHPFFLMRQKHSDVVGWLVVSTYYARTTTQPTAVVGYFATSTSRLPAAWNERGSEALPWRYRMVPYRLYPRLE